MQDLERDKEKLLRMFQEVFDLEDRVISCDECGSQLGVYIDMELDGGDPTSQFLDVSQHLAHCPDCRRVYLEDREILEMERKGELVEPPIYPALDFSFVRPQDEQAPPSPLWEWLGNLLEKLLRPFQWPAYQRMVLAAAVVLLALGLTVSILLPDISSSLGPPQAVIISFVPKVEIKRANTARMIPTSFSMPLYQGDVVNTYDGAAVSIICENGLLLNLPEQNNLTVDCEDTTDTRIIARLGPTLNNQLVCISDVYTITQAIDETRRPTRHEQEQIPLLLHPRNTVVTDTRPTFHWQFVAGATGYRLSLISPSGQGWSTQTSDTSLPYPTDKLPLALGSANVIRLQTVDDRSAVEETVLQVLDEASLAELTEAETAIQALAVDEAAQGYLLAQLYREREMWGAAIAQLERLADEQGIASAYLFQHLGDLYVEVELYGQAEENYRRALNAAETSTDKSAQAAAHVGLAQTAHISGQTEQGLDHLSTAKDLYRQAGETERAEMVAAARAKLEKPTSTNYTWLWGGGVAVLLLIGSVVVWRYKSIRISKFWKGD